MRDTDEGCRLDIWLYRTRLTKTRREAQTLISKRKVRLTRAGVTNRVSKPHFIVRPGDQLSFMRARQLYNVEMLSVGVRRGPAREAQTLYRTLETPDQPS